MPKIESEKIDCLYRPCSRPAPRGKIESVRTHSEVIEQFDSFSMLQLLFLVRNEHCWSRKAFPRQMTPQSREKTAKTAVFQHRWQAWKVVRSIAAVRQRPRTPRNWRCSFAFLETFLWHFNKKQRAEVIFRLSRPVSCKNQENGSGKRWSLHAPLKLYKGFVSLQWRHWRDDFDLTKTVEVANSITDEGNISKVIRLTHKGFCAWGGGGAKSPPPPPRRERVNSRPRQNEPGPRISADCRPTRSCFAKSPGSQCD